MLNTDCAIFMIPEQLSILVVECDVVESGIIQDVLSKVGLVKFSVQTATHLEDALERLKDKRIDVVVLDMGLGGGESLTTFRELRKAAPGVALIILIGPGQDEQAVVAMREGAHQWLLKGEITGSVLMRVLLYAFECHRTEIRERLARQTLEMLNRQQNLEETILEFLRVVKRAIDFDAVGIRLRDGDDFPYYQTIGFSEAFICAERFLCAKDRTGEVLRDDVGDPVLECMCGNILRGRTNPVLPFFTDGGSFWTNSTTKLLAGTTEKDRNGRTRNRCHREGYESVALIPLRNATEIIGLLQLNDQRTNRLTPGMIQFFEGLGASVGIALQHKKAEGMLRDSQQRLEFVLQGGGLGSWDWYPQTGDVAYSELWAAMLDYSPEEVQPSVDFFKQHLHPDDLPSTLERLMAHVEGRTLIYESEHRLRAKSGAWKWVRDRGRIVVRDKDGRPSRVAGVVEDITTRKLVESALRESRANLARAELFSHMMVTQIGLDGRWLKVPPLLGRLLGYEEAELLALRIQDVLHPDDAECDWWQYQRILVSDIKSFSTEKRFVARNGRQLWLDASVSLVTDDRNQPERFLTYLRDITEHKQAEDRIRMQAESLDLAHDAIVVLDLSGRILSWNGGAHRLFGRSPEETIGQEFIRLLSEKETGQMRACLEQTLRTGLCNRHLEKLTRAGVKVDVQSSWRLLKSQGGLPQAFLIVETEIGQTMPD